MAVLLGVYSAPAASNQPSKHDTYRLLLHPASITHPRRDMGVRKALELVLFSYSWAQFLHSHIIGLLCCSQCKCFIDAEFTVTGFPSSSDIKIRLRTPSGSGKWTAARPRKLGSFVGVFNVLLGLSLKIGSRLLGSGFIHRFSSDRCMFA